LTKTKVSRCKRTVTVGKDPALFIGDLGQTGGYAEKKTAPLNVKAGGIVGDKFAPEIITLVGMEMSGSSGDVKGSEAAHARWIGPRAAMGDRTKTASGLGEGGGRLENTQRGTTWKPLHQSGERDLQVSR